ncbi:alpha-amylase family glycosyl hydrolase [Kiritimatiellaeota bacterium B1221]|nr:alpha-amylase family glycosyl hydrolase [Kiritimatiellaeota bacterium B1221]
MTQPSSPSGRLNLHPVAIAVTAILFIAVLIAGFRYASMKKAPLQESGVPAPSIPREQKSTHQMPSPPAPAPSTASTPTAAPAAVPPPVSSDLILSNQERGIPGNIPSEWIYYQTLFANSVKISGAWDGWHEKISMQKAAPGLWAFSVSGIGVPFGSYEFKFIVDGEWESGANRILHINEAGQMERPPQVVSQALIEHPHQIRIRLYEKPENPAEVAVSLKPDLGALKLRWQTPREDPAVQGYRMTGNEVEFVFDPASYGMSPQDIHSAQVAGNFNDWNAEAADTRMKREGETWRVRLPYPPIDSKVSQGEILFKFVINDEWKSPPADAPNAMLEPGTTHMNLQLPRADVALPELIIQTAEPIDLSQTPLVQLTGLHEKTIHVWPSPGSILDTLYSPKKMGVTLDPVKNETTYRIFAPRASSVTLGLFDGPYYVTAEETPVEPAQKIDMKKDQNGVWEHRQPGLHTGQYYAYQIAGPLGNGEGFNPAAWLGDPYATAVGLAEGNSMVMDLHAGSVQPQPRPRVAWEDMVIYETHMRHFTQHPSSGVPEHLRGKYPGVLATTGTGTGLDHLKALGVNVIQFMPLHEFNNGFSDKHDWGYATSFFFAPESSYATRPLEGSQVAEFRELVDGLHQQGFAVFMDVVYNHIGGLNVFNLIDRKYYFRLNPDYTNVDYSGCGNDVASERLMMRRLIIESVLFWVEEYGIDGFRFDLCELIDDQTLLEIEREIRNKHPHVVLHSEPWSFRGSHKDFLGPTTWGAWNDRFREPAKQFVRGHGGKADLKQAIRGSVENWTRHPLQSVNYMESHDDHALVDELTTNPDHDGRELSERDERIHKLAATLIFGSLGTPLITEGQAYLRSKHGIRNTYNKGDELNSLRWHERERDHAKEVLTYYKQMIAFRLSPEGAALRVKDNPSLDYTRFIETDSDQVLGWTFNAHHERPGVPAVMILMNASEQEQTFNLNLASGNWIRVGDGDQVLIHGDGTTLNAQQNSIKVPAQTAFIYRTRM